MIPFRTPLLLAAVALATSCAPIDMTDAGSARGTALKLATWNLEHLAERDGEGCRPRTETEYAELRRHAAALDADVVAFQEVENRAAAERVFDPAHFDVVVSNRPPGRRGGECAGAPGRTIRQQDVGFAIRKGTRWKRNADLAALGLGNPDLRWGVDVTIDGRSPVRLLVFHLKSGCNTGRSATDPDCAVLFDQLPVLMRRADDRAAAGEAFAVMGDWNRRLAAHGDQFFGQLDRPQSAATDLALTNGGAAATCKARYREFIDHIVVDPRASGRVIPGTFAEYTYGTAEDRHPSDHCPVSVTLRR